MKRMKILNVVGARPNFVKIAPIVAAMKTSRRLRSWLVHTGQHYDHNMSKLFFDEMGLPRPDVNLEVGSSSHAQQTAAIMTRFEPVVERLRPDAVLVVGDVNSTIACALVAVKLGVRVVHVEAGLRSRDRTMPEEINRLLTDQISDLLFVTCKDAIDNLVAEGIDRRKIHFVGNVMIDSLKRFRPLAEKSDVVGRLGLVPHGYALLTLHRPSNVDRPGDLRHFLGTLREVAERLPVVFPLHPRTRARIEASPGLRRAARHPNILLIEPLGYLDFMKLMMDARLVLTDSGGIQEETTVLRVPCLTLRENTERPITVAEGTSELVGRDRAKILAGVERILAGKWKAGRIPKYWDGRAAQRIVRVLEHVAKAKSW
ncbi:MAG: UDP-N-acetylglucosamine 2-epimerase (non-hydrolyzing) [Candidatus Sumerlaeia bacterium]|nr:UDP-N-acetylglucosamine 2-epimerase (non-hydrolyzing) [Candidatus Sumerlaeia bacterium]